MQTNLETARLILRRLTPDDAAAAFKWCGDPRVNRFMMYPLYQNQEDVRAWLETLAAEGPDHYTYGFILKETGEPIGSGGMYNHPEEDVWHIGYNLRFDMWNKGLTTEGMRAILDTVCAEREVRVIEAEHAAANPASGRVMQKLGLQFSRTGSYAKLDGSEVFPSRIYRIERATGQTP